MLTVLGVLEMAHACHCAILPKFPMHSHGHISVESVWMVLASRH